MAKSSRSKCSKYELGAYLAVGMGSLSVASGTEAAVVSININAFGLNGANGGTAIGETKTVANFPTSGQGELLIINSNDTSGPYNTRMIGISGLYDPIYNPVTGYIDQVGIKFAVNQINVYGNTKKFSAGASIDSSSTFDGNSTFFFRFSKNGAPYFYKYSPDFGAGSYVGFKTIDGNYGYLEVTWSRTSKEFFILSGAYESTPNTPILAGATPGGGGGGNGAVPEPTSGAIAALLMGGTALRQWRKKRREETNEAIAS